MRQTYRVEVRRGERWWVLSVPAIRAAHSQACHLREAEPTARDLIAVMLGVAPDSFDVDIRMQPPAEVAGRNRPAEKRGGSAQAAIDWSGRE